MQNLLQEVMGAISTCDERPIVIFDLDDTLYATARRNLIIIQNFAADFGDEYPAFAALSAKLTLNDMEWGVSDALHKAGLPAGDPSLSPFITYWGNRFFTNEYVKYDLPNVGAVDFANACYNAGALVFYLTGRHVGQPAMNNGMELGTMWSFLERGFPFFKGLCELNLKTDIHEKDADYKGRVIKQINALGGKVIASFDNEPRNVAVYSKHFPEAMNVWMKTTWDPKDDTDTSKFTTITSFL
jgi:hypothetical protein